MAGSALVDVGAGLRFAGGAVRRLETRTPDATGGASWGPGIGGGSIQAGETWRFQVWYRDPVGGPCGSGFNLSNGYEVAFTP